jgi:hypothetical protein
MHNIDVMHQECIASERILSTCMCVTDKIKDNKKARKKRSIYLNAKFEILIWLRHGFLKSYEFGIRKNKWSEKS